MKKCDKCGCDNRDHAVYCRHCGTQLLKLSPDNAGDGLVGKDSLKDKLADFSIKCSQATALRQKTGQDDSHPGLDCCIIGEAGVGKTFLALHLVKMLYAAGICDSPTPTRIDTADWDDWSAKIDEKLSRIKGGVLLVTNCQRLVKDGESELDKLFARMRTSSRMPIVILCGLQEGFGTYIGKNKNVSSLFEYILLPPPLDEKSLTDICVHTMSDKYKMMLTESARERLRLVFKKKFRDGESGENGVLAAKTAEAAVVSALARKSPFVDVQDIKGEAFKEMTEEEIWAQLDAYVGLGNVKKEIRGIIENIKAQKRDNPGKPVKIMDHYVFSGNPGTGKTTIARLFADILNTLEVLPTGQLVEVNPRKDLVSNYVGDTALKTEAAVNRAMGGVLFIDEAYSIKNGDNDSFGKEAVATLVPLLTNKAGEFVCIAAGYTADMIHFLEANQGLKSRFSKTIEFEDYNARELEKIFLNLLAKEGITLNPDAQKRLPRHFDGMYLKRTKDFGNAREVVTLFREAKRNMGARRNALSDEERKAQGMMMTWEDIVGEEGAREVTVEDVMKELDDFVGMASVKEAVRKLAEDMEVSRIMAQYGGKASLTPVNILLTGNPGTGKTSVARLFGRLFKAMGMIPTDRVVEKKPGDILSTYVNDSDKNMDAAVNEAMGGVLFIDEAYALADYDETGHCNNDEGLKALTRLMTRMYDDAGKFVLVCAGYKTKMRNLYKANEGFRRRFSHEIDIEDYTPDELTEIFVRMAGKKFKLRIPDDTREVLRRCFEKVCVEKAGPQFGNAGEAEKLLNEVKRRQSARIKPQLLEVISKGGQPSEDLLFVVRPEDIPYEDKPVASEEECLKELDALVGLDGVKDEIRKLLETIKAAKMNEKLYGEQGKTPLADHYLFLGNPGTGKTTVARLMGRIFHTLGLLPREDVVEVSAADMIGRFRGTTAPIVREKVDGAMGGVLFIDEAYTLVRDEQYGQEAIGELLTLLQNRAGRFVCIAAGYTNEMEAFVRSNPGISSRFSKRIYFEDYDMSALSEILRRKVSGEKYELAEEANVAIEEVFWEIYATRDENFGNAREVGNFWKYLKAAISRRVNPLVQEKILSGEDSSSITASVRPRTIIPGDVLEAYEEYKKNK